MIRIEQNLSILIKINQKHACAVGINNSIRVIQFKNAKKYREIHNS